MKYALAPIMLLLALLSAATSALTGGTGDPFENWLLWMEEKW